MSQDEQLEKQEELKLDHIQVLKIAGSLKIYELDPDTQKDEEGVYDFRNFPPSLIFDGGPDDECLFEAITTHFGTEKEDLDLVYKDLESMIEALAEHYGFQGVQFHESKEKAVDPLEAYSPESLDNREDVEPEIFEIEVEDDGEPSMGDLADEAESIMGSGMEGTGEDLGIEEWEDDDEE